MDATITEDDVAMLQSHLVHAFAEAAGENDGNWRQVASTRVPGTYSGGHQPYLSNWSALDDRIDGRYRPFYDNENDLRTIRAKSRNLATFTSIVVGAASALRVYTVGGQWKFEAQAREGVAASRGLLAAIQGCVDDALEQSDFQGVYDEIIHDAAREDGEALITVHGVRDGDVRIRTIDADCLREPLNISQIERGLQGQGYGRYGLQSWSFGVHTAWNEAMRRIDHADPLGYHVVYDETGRNWDYLPAFPQGNCGRLSNKCLVHLKLNVPPDAKRGVSDYYPIQEVLERKHILGRNLAVGAAIQASIAYIRHHKGNVTRDQVVQRISAALDSVSRVSTGTRTDGRLQQNFAPGTVVDTATEYHAGPLGENRSPIYLEVCAYLMRCVGIRWLMPEYMISGDASNANFASTLVAESPFVRAREADQRKFAACFKRILWAAIKIKHDAGGFAPYVRSWRQLRDTVELSIKPPTVASRDRTQLLAEATTLYDKRLISANDVLTDLGREPRPELDDQFAEPPKPAMPFGNPSVMAAQQAAMAAALESVETTEEAKAILESVQREHIA